MADNKAQKTQPKKWTSRMSMENEANVPDWVLEESKKMRATDAAEKAKQKREAANELKREYNRGTKRFSGGGNAVGTVGKGGQRLSKANWNTWEPKDEEDLEREERARVRGMDTQHRTNKGENADGEEAAEAPEAPTELIEEKTEPTNPGVTATPPPPSPSQPRSFSAAFGEARKAGEKTFEWNGKKYTTAMKGSTSSKPAKANTAPVSPKERSSYFNFPSGSDSSMPKSMKGTEKYAAGAGSEKKTTTKTSRPAGGLFDRDLSFSYPERKKTDREKAQDAKKAADKKAAEWEDYKLKAVRAGYPNNKEALERLKTKKGYKAGGNVKKNWIAGAIKKPGALRQSLGVKEGEKIPAKKLAKAAKAPGKMGQRARLAQTLKGFSKGGGIESRGKTRCKIV